MVEVIVSLTVSIILLTTFQTLIIQMIKINRSSESSFLASVYLRELIEVAKDLEKSDWSEITKAECLIPNKCYPKIESSEWKLFPTTTAETIRNNGYVYERWLSVENINASTSKVIAQITWKNVAGATSSSTLENYIYNY